MSLAKLQIFFVSLFCIFIQPEDCLAKKKKKRRGSSPSAYLEDRDLFFGGLNFGLSLSQVDGDNFVGYNKADLNFSAIAYTKINDNMAFSTEVGYNTKGSKAKHGKETPFRNAHGDIVDDFLIRLAYADITFLGNIFDTKQNNFGLGFSYGRLIRSEEYINNEEIETDYPFQKNTIDAVLNGNFRITKAMPLFFNLRFQYSIIPVRKDYAGIYGRTEQINKQILLRAAYVF